MNNNVGNEFQSVLKGKYGTALIVIAGLVLLWMFIQILPRLVEGALVLALVYFVLRWLTRKS